MYFKKIHLNKAENKYIPSTTDHDEYVEKKVQQIAIGVIEIGDVDTPSDLVLIITVKGEKFPIPLLKYRSKFLYQNQRFILDTSNIKEFTIVHPMDFSIEVLTDLDFYNITMYYPIEQEERHPLGFRRTN